MNINKIINIKQEYQGKVCFFPSGLKYHAYNEDSYLLEKMCSLESFTENNIDYVRFPKQQAQYYINKLKEFGHEVIIIED